MTRTQAWGLKGENGVVFTVTLNDNVVRRWKEQGIAYVELIEREEQKNTIEKPAATSR